MQLDTGEMFLVPDKVKADLVKVKLPSVILFNNSSVLILDMASSFNLQNNHLKKGRF